MSHKLARLSKSILEQPQLIVPKRLEEIAGVLESGEERLYEAAQEAIKLSEQNGDDSSNLDLAEGNVGVLRIEGALTNKPTMFGALCGLTSYQDLIIQTEELVGMENINTIMMLVDSGGGEAYNAFLAAMNVKEMVNSSGKKLIAYIDGHSGSAAYAWTAVADEVIIHPDAMAGSIGVVVRLTNTNKADKEAGIETTYITAGDSKVPFDKAGDFREDFKQDIQDRVDELYLGFISHVAENRGISEQVVMDTEAKMFSANKALELGLVDKIMSNEEFYEYLADISQDPEDTKSTTKKANVITLESQESPSMETPMSKENIEASVDVSDAQLAKLAEMEATLAAQAEVIAQFQAEKEAQAQAALKQEITESLSAYSFLAESKDSVVSFLASADEESKALLTSVLGEAQASLDAQAVKAEEELSAVKAEKEAIELASKEFVEEAEASKDAIKEEFAVSENADSSAPVAELTPEQMVQLKVKEKLAARKAAKIKA